MHSSHAYRFILYWYDLNTKTFCLVPDLSKGSRPASVSTVESAVRVLVLRHEDVEGELELDLPWDPLASSSLEIETCQESARQLLSLEDTGSSFKTCLDFQEVFLRSSLNGKQHEKQIVERLRLEA